MKIKYKLNKESSYIIQSASMLINKEYNTNNIDKDDFLEIIYELIKLINKFLGMNNENII